MSSDTTTEIALYVADADNKSYKLSPTVQPIKIQFGSQPFFFDVNGDRK